MLRLAILVSLVFSSVVTGVVFFSHDGSGPETVAALDDAGFGTVRSIDLNGAPEHRKDSNRKLQSPLAQIDAAFNAYGPTGANIVASSMGISTSGGVRVVLETDGDAHSVGDALHGIGIDVEAEAAGLVQASVPVEALAEVADVSGVSSVRLPLIPVPADEITGKGVHVTGADAWHAAGTTGAGVKVAVLDLGFDGYQGLLGTELPNTVVTHSCREDGDLSGEGEPHGTAVAEIVNEMAPAAELYLANFNSEVEMADCVEWLAEQGVDVINMSVGFYASGPGDGTGVIDEIAATATSQGIVWLNSAGNEADQHWTGEWSDPDGDGFMNFAADDESNYVDVREGTSVTFILKWDDPFGMSCNDYDMYLFDPTGTTILAGSENYQDYCTSGMASDPVESFSYEVPVTGRYHLAISSYDSNEQATFHLYSLNQQCPVLQYCVAESSVVEPADSLDIIAVGAGPWNDPTTTEDFSSEGPTTDGRTKPDLIAPDGVSSVTYGVFYGTSASVAHATGAAALIRQWKPDWSIAEIKDFLTSRALDLGEPGPDNVTGAGLLQLGMPKPTPTPTNTPTATPSPAPTATPTPLGPIGDVDCDGVVTVRDAQLVLQFTALLVQQLPCEYGADANRDGSIDANDAVTILWITADLV